MVDLDQFYFLRRNDNFLLFELKDLSVKRHIGRLQKKLAHPTYLDDIFSLNLSFKRLDEESGEKTANKSENSSDITSEEIKSDKNNQKSDLNTEISDTSKNQAERELFEYPEINENLLCGVPELIKHTDQASGLPVYFYFIIGKETVLIAVSREFYLDIKKELINFLHAFEKIFDVEQILTAKGPLQSPELMREFSMIFTDHILVDYLIPNSVMNYISDGQIINRFKTDFDYYHYFVKSKEGDKEISVDHQIKSVLKQSFNKHISRNLGTENYLGLYEMIDGFTDIESLSLKLKVPTNVFKQYLLLLWEKKIIYFRIPRYDWDLFERTHRSNQFLYDGSEEQKNMIEKYSGGKIISLLSRFDGKTSLKNIRKKMVISDLKFMKYVYDLIDMELIEVIPVYPIIKTISEDMIPLLIIQGLSPDDLELIEKLESLMDGTATILDVAYNVKISPEKIKNIVDKLGSINIVKI
jgi:hypothetical protein